MDEIITCELEKNDLVEINDYNNSIVEWFSQLPEVARPLLKTANESFENIKNMLYKAPAFIKMVKANVPEEMFQAVLTDEQKEQLAKGTLKLLTKKDGSLLAELVDPNTRRIVAQVPLEAKDLTPALNDAMANYAMQMQLAQIAEEIREIQIAVEEVRQGQEYDRLAMAYSCQQKFLQTMQIKNPELRTKALLAIAFDAEDSRNLLMQSQSANLLFIKDQPESFWKKLLVGANPDKINSRMNDIRQSLTAVNTASLVEALAYQQLGEMDAARQSLCYYANYIQEEYLSTEGFVQRLDLIDVSPENYWSNTLPDIKEKILALPCANNMLLLEGENNE